MSYFPALLSALMRRTPPPVPPTVPLHLLYAGQRSVRPASVGLLVQHFHHCPVHGTQLVSVLEPGCDCTP